MPGNSTVLRPLLATMPGPAWIYCAFGLRIKYPTVRCAFVRVHEPSGLNDGQVFRSAGASLAVFFTPFGLKITRSPAGSPLRFESTVLRTVPGSPDSNA